MSLLKSLAGAVSVFTVFPVPLKSWDDGNLKYLLAVFPITGVIVAFFEYLLYHVLYFIPAYVPDNVYYMVAAIIPALITGGIHIDGFMDVSDGLSSHKSGEEQLRIMKDPHIGAFACIKLVVYYIAYMAGLSLVRSKAQVLLLGAGFVISRALSSFALLCLPSAKTEGMSFGFKDKADALTSKVILVIWVFLCSVYAYYILGIWGVAVIGVCLMFFFYYEVMAVKKYGGLTGDTAGWFLCIFELIFAWLTGVVGWVWFL